MLLPIRSISSSIGIRTSIITISFLGLGRVTGKYSVLSAVVEVIMLLPIRSISSGIGIRTSINTISFLGLGRVEVGPAS